MYCAVIGNCTEVDRMAAAISRRGRRLLQRLFTPAEIAYCEKHRNRAERLAGHFAAKEAAMKALGTGRARGVRWIHIGVVREPSGKPTPELSGASRAHAGGKKHRCHHRARWEDRPGGNLRIVKCQSVNPKLHIYPY